MSIEQEKMIVESLSSLYPLQEFEEKAIQTILDALPPAQQNLSEEYAKAVRNWLVNYQIEKLSHLASIRKMECDSNLKN